MDTAATSLLNAIVTMKCMYDQRQEYKEEIMEVQAFLKEYQEQLPALHRRFRECEGNSLGGVALKLLEADISNVTNKLVKYAKNGTFFSIFTSRQRMQELQKLHRNVMASVQKNVGIAGLSMLLDVRASQVEMQGGLLRSTSELESLVTTSIARMSGDVAREVRAEIVQASRTSFVENEKFWADVLAASDKSETESSSLRSDCINSQGMFSSMWHDSDQCPDQGSSGQLYRDPITNELFVDPVNTSNGETYDRWTIIDKNMTKDPFNPSIDLQILGDNISVRRALFEDFPDQWKKFRQRRDDYRRKALFLAKKGLFADAVLALQHVIQWDRTDKECGEALAQAKAALEYALYAQRCDKALLQQHRHQITKTAAIIKPAINLEDGDSCASPYQPVHVIADVPISPMSAISNEDRDEIWIVRDSDQDSPSKTMSPTPEFFKPMKEIKKITNAHSGNWIESVSYSPDGSRIATTSFDKTAIVWDAERGKILFTLRGHKFLVRSSAWSPTGNELATGSYDHTTKVWDTKTGEILYTLKSHHDRVNSVAWNPNGMCLATGSDDGTAILWDVKSRDAMATFSANIGPVSSVAWNPNGQFLAVAYKLKSIRVWDATRKKVVFELKCLITGAFNHVAWSPDGCEFAAASTNQTAVVFNVASRDVRLTLRGHSREVVHVAWSPDGTRLATASKDSTATVWNAISGAALYTLKHHSSSLSSLAWRNDGARLATTSEGGSVTIWASCEDEADRATPKLAKFLGLKSRRENLTCLSLPNFAETILGKKKREIKDIASGIKGPSQGVLFSEVLAKEIIIEENLWPPFEQGQRRKTQASSHMNPEFVPSLEDQIVLRRRPKHQGEFMYQYPWSYRGREMPVILHSAQLLRQKYIQLNEFEEMCYANNVQGKDKFEFGRGRLTAALFPDAFLYHLQLLIQFKAPEDSSFILHSLRIAADLVVNDLPYEEVGQSFKFFDEACYGDPLNVGIVFSLGGLVAIGQNFLHQSQNLKGLETDCSNEYCIVQHDLTGTYLRRRVETNILEQLINEDATGVLGVKVRHEDVHVENMRDDGSYYSGNLKDFSYKFKINKNKEETMDNQCANRLFGHLKGGEFLGKDSGLKCSPLLIVVLASASQTKSLSLTWNMTYGHMEVWNSEHSRCEEGEWQILYTNKINHFGMTVEWGMDPVMGITLKNPQGSETSQNGANYASVFGNAVQDKRTFGLDISFGGFGIGGSFEKYGSKGRELATVAHTQMKECMQRERGGFVETSKLDTKHIYVQEHLLQGTLHQAPHNYLVVCDDVNESDHVSIYCLIEDDKLEWITDIVLPGGKKGHKTLFKDTLKGLYLKVKRDGSNMTSTNLRKPGTDLFSRFRERIEGKGIGDSMKEVPQLGSTSNDEWKHIIGAQAKYLGNKFWWEATYMRAIISSRTKYSSGAILKISTTVIDNNIGKIGHCERGEFDSSKLIHQCVKVAAKGKFSKPPASLVESANLIKWGGLVVQDDLC